MKKFSLLIVVSVMLAFNCCSKSGSSGGSVMPSDLNVTAVVGSDSSGNVSFTATATNAVTYEFNYGNGIFAMVAGGVVTYRYPSGGTYTVTVIARSSSGLTVSKTIQVTVAVTTSLVWSDEFNIPGSPDPSKWGYDIGTGSGGWGNNELEYYTNRSNNVNVQNGVLKITAVKENYVGSAYTSARLLSQNKFSFKYGKIEVRAKLPAGVGTWPAIWMMGDNINTAGWPASGETDIMEHRGSELNKIFGTLHYPGHSGGNATGGTTVIADATTAFHNYMVDWSATDIKFYVDSQLFFTFSNNAALPFNQNFFIILNVAMGGNFAGPVDPAFTSASMEIDYVRVYQ